MPESKEEKQIAELFTKGVIRKGNDPYLIIKRLSTGLTVLDDLLGGGIPLGRCIEGYGPESTGKTLIAQYMAKSVQESDYPVVLYMDMERSYDKVWWEKTGVDTDELLVSEPATGQQAIDVMRSMIHSEPRLGLIILDSLAAMIPANEMDPENSTEDTKQQPGAQAKLITRMYQQIVPLLDNRIILYAANQMRDNIGGYDELGALPGGHSQRHYNSIILRTRRESWIKDSSGQNNIGFYMDITSRKNKTCSTPDGTNILLPFLAEGQIDMLTMFIEDAIKHGIIVKGGPYYKWANTKYLGMRNLRNFFRDHPEEITELENAVSLDSI